MKHVKIEPPDTFDRLMDTRDVLAATRAMLGNCIAGLNGAAKTLEQIGCDGSIYRELADEAKALRWAR